MTEGQPPSVSPEPRTHHTSVLDISCNPGYKARLDQMTDDYKLHMQKMIKNHSTWDGVPEDHKATHRNVDGVLTPKESWGKQPVTV